MRYLFFTNILLELKIYFCHFIRLNLLLIKNNCCWQQKCFDECYPVLCKVKYTIVSNWQNSKDSFETFSKIPYVSHLEFVIKGKFPSVERGRFLEFKNLLFSKCLRILYLFLGSTYQTINEPKMWKFNIVYFENVADLLTSSLLLLLLLFFERGLKGFVSKSVDSDFIFIFICFVTFDKRRKDWRTKDSTKAPGGVHQNVVCLTVFLTDNLKWGSVFIQTGLCHI